MELRRLDLDLTVCKLNGLDGVDWSGEFYSLSKTKEELSFVCETNHMPKNTIAFESGWKALMIAGVLDFGMVGVIAGISKLLADAGIPIFVVSTYNTDYILMKSEDVENGVRILRENAYVVV